MTQATQHLVTWMALFVVALATTIFPSTVQAVPTASTADIKCLHNHNDNWFTEVKKASGGQTVDWNSKELRVAYFKRSTQSSGFYEFITASPSGTYFLLTRTSTATSLQVVGTHRVQFMNYGGVEGTASSSGSITYTGITEICGLSNTDIDNRTDNTPKKTFQKSFPYNANNPIAPAMAFQDSAGNDTTVPTPTTQNVNIFSQSVPLQTTAETGEPTTGGVGITDEQIAKGFALLVTFTIVYVIVKQFRYRA